jgi:hypothetical protein
MGEFLCKKNNIFQRNYLVDEKKRVDTILEFLKIQYSMNEIKEKDYIKIKNKFEVIFKNKENSEIKQKKILIDTRNYLNLQLQKIIKEKNNSFLLKEIEIELKEINNILKNIK